MQHVYSDLEYCVHKLCFCCYMYKNLSPDDGQYCRQLPTAAVDKQRLRSVCNFKAGYFSELYEYE